MSAVSTTLALKELDEEEARLKGVLVTLNEQSVKARRELEEIQVARRVMERIQTQHGEPQGSPTSSDSEPDAESEGGEGLTIKQAALRALKTSYPAGLHKSVIEDWIKINLSREVNSASLSVMLARLRDRDHAITNRGNAWFYVPPSERRAA